MLYFWYPKKRGDWDAIHEENGVIKTPEDLVSVKKQLKWGKHTCLAMRIEHPRAFQEPTGLLSRNYRTPIKKLQDFYQEPMGLLSRTHRTPIKKV